MQAVRWSLGAQQVDSRSGEFRVTGADEAATVTASQAFAADIKALAHMLARACFHISKERKPFDVTRCFA